MFHFRASNNQFGHTIPWIQGIVREVFLFVKIHSNASIIKQTKISKKSVYWLIDFRKPEVVLVSGET